MPTASVVEGIDLLADSRGTFRRVLSRPVVVGVRRAQAAEAAQEGLVHASRSGEAQTA